MNDVLIFRNFMAERGYEYTPEEAKEILKTANNFLNTILKMSKMEPEYFSKLSSLSIQEKRNLCRNFANRGIEITLSELEGLIELILHVKN